MWETTFPRNSHAGLGRPFYEPNMLVSMLASSSSPYPIRRGYFSEMLFPTWSPLYVGWSMCEIRFCVGQKNHKIHIAHPTDSVRSVGQCAILSFVFLGHKITRWVSYISTVPGRLVDVRDSVLHFLAKKITRCISHISPIQFGRLVDVRDSVFCFLARKILVPKRRVWKAEQKFRTLFSKHFSIVMRPNWVLTYLKVLWKNGPKRLFGLTKSSFGDHKNHKMHLSGEQKSRTFSPRHCGEQKSRTFAPRTKRAWKT